MVVSKGPVGEEVHEKFCVWEVGEGEVVRARVSITINKGACYFLNVATFLPLSVQPKRQWSGCREHW